MSYGPITQEQFSAALGRLGERDVVRLVRAGAFDGDEAQWAAAWLRGERPAKEAPRVLTLAHEEPARPDSGFSMSALWAARKSEPRAA